MPVHKISQAFRSPEGFFILNDRFRLDRDPDLIRRAGRMPCISFPMKQRQDEAVSSDSILPAAKPMPGFRREGSGIWAI
jgi:hypothetical protein